MRASWLAVPLFVLAAAACGDTDVGGDGDGGNGDGGAVDACVGLECFQVSCPGGGTTSVSGTVYAPNGSLPLYNVIVYVPNSAVEPLPAGATCDRCGQAPSGNPVVQAITDTQGQFVLENVPVTDNLPLVIQVGKWRRQVTIPTAVASCTDTPLDAAVTRLPKNQSEGDIPQMALTTGSADALECLLRKIGLDDSEFTTSSGSGRVHLFTGNGTPAFNATLGGATFANATTLWDTTAHLMPYDVAFLSCEGSQRTGTKPTESRQALSDYTNVGGRVFMSHWHNIWLGGEAGNPGHGIAEWRSIIDFDFRAAQNEMTQTAIIDRGSSRGETFATWLKNVGATTDDTLTIREPRYTAKRLGSPELAQTWLHVDPTRSTPLGKTSVQDVVFTTPVGADTDARCGKVVFSDMHVSSGSSSKPSIPYPSSCATGDLTPQEKALAFILFDMAACVSPIL